MINGDRRQSCHDQLESVLAQLKPALQASAGEIAGYLLRPRNRRLSARAEWRWGKKGSFRLWVSGPKRGRWLDFEAGESGDILGRRSDAGTAASHSI